MKRRTFNKGALGTLVCAGMGANTSELFAKPKAPEDMGPKKGDLLVYDKGPKKGELVLAEHLKLDEEQVIAYPFDPVSKVARNGSRLNKLMAIRLNPDELDKETSANVADGGVAVYSAICTHRGCDVNAWVADKKNFFCYCHLSLFDPRENGKVTSGPAPRRLPMVPIVINEKGQLVVSSSFTSRPGFKKSR